MGATLARDAVTLGGPLRGPFLGEVVRLQVQRRPAKTGTAPDRCYDPGGIHPVAELAISPDGARGRSADGADLLDVHHAAHPQTRNRSGRNPLSLGTTASYAAMRERFGPVVVDGVAGENVLVRTERELGIDDLSGGLVVETADGGLGELTGLAVAKPCVEFTRYCLGRTGAGPVDDEVRAGLEFLDAGRRGFVAVPVAAARLRPGARVWAARVARPDRS